MHSGSHDQRSNHRRMNGALERVVPRRWRSKCDRTSAAGRHAGVGVRYADHTDTEIVQNLVVVVREVDRYLRSRPHRECRHVEGDVLRRHVERLGRWWSRRWWRRRRWRRWRRWRRSGGRRGCWRRCRGGGRGRRCGGGRCRRGRGGGCCCGRRLRVRGRDARGSGPNRVRRGRGWCGIVAATGGGGRGQGEGQEEHSELHTGNVR